MSRKRNTTRTGQPFSKETLAAVWRKGRVATGHHESKTRRDTCGALIDRSAYGSTTAARGWEIDHIKPVAKGGDDELSNLQPLQWENNRHKGDDWPKWDCAVGSK